MPRSEHRIVEADIVAPNIYLGMAHPQYGHMAVVPAEVRSELAKDFD
jgi:hypothetical protein